jgi:hypothetical protein
MPLCRRIRASSCFDRASAGAALRLCVAVAAAGSLSPTARADHGPGTTGGSTTPSGETLKSGKLSLGFRWDYSQFESLNSAEIEHKAERVHGEDAHFDALRWNMLFAVDLAYGVLDDFQLGVSTGFYRGDDVREAHHEETGEVELHDHGDVTGVTDLWVNAKYRVLKGPYGHWALIGGIKFPTGRDDVRSDDDGERLEPSLQPGSGAFDFLLGTAYSVWLAEGWMLDAGVSYTFRTENDEFQLGDRFDAGAAVTLIVLGDPQNFPMVGIYLEPSLRHIQRNIEDSHHVDNSGGTVIFLSPGVRVALNERFSFMAAPQFPVLQELNDEQQETLFKVLAGFTITF